MSPQVEGAKTGDPSGVTGTGCTLGIELSSPSATQTSVGESKPSSGVAGSGHGLPASGVVPQVEESSPNRLAMTQDPLPKR